MSPRRCDCGVGIGISLTSPTWGSPLFLVGLVVIVVAQNCTTQRCTNYRSQHGRFNLFDQTISTAYWIGLHRKQEQVIPLLELLSDC